MHIHSAVLTLSKGSRLLIGRKFTSINSKNSYHATIVLELQYKTMDSLRKLESGLSMVWLHFGFMRAKFKTVSVGVVEGQVQLCSNPHQKIVNFSFAKTALSVLSALLQFNASEDV